MLEATQAALSFVEGLDERQFCEDLRTIYATRAALTTIGEAANRVPETLRDGHPSIPWRQIRAFRNFLVHVYDQVDPVRLHQTVTDELPNLETSLLALLATLEQR
jgi:uncharacterized protein with HEPN domain